MAGQWTAEQIEEAIPGAIGDAAWPAVEGLMLMLAARDPERADRMFMAMRDAMHRRSEGT